MRSSILIKQKGQPAVEANNLFYYLTYEGAVDLDKVMDPIQKLSYEVQIREFGQCPKQLFTHSHPSRGSEDIQGAKETKMATTFATTTSPELIPGVPLDEILVSIQSEGAAREWSTVVIVIVIFIS